LLQLVAERIKHNFVITALFKNWPIFLIVRTSDQRHGLQASKDIQMNIASSLLRSMALATALTVAAGTVWAAGSGSGGGSAPPTPAAPASPKVLKCKKGFVVKTTRVNGVRKKRCVKLVAGVLPDAELYGQGYALAKDGEYDWALDVLATVQNQSDADVLNMQGYSHRKAGRLDVAITYYRRALDINPDFVRAREYLGEGYVAAGRVDLAQAELDQIKARCGVTCEEYSELSKVISAAAN
jgi:tetratricopeptide (TPR) repeat protein